MRRIAIVPAMALTFASVASAADAPAWLDPAAARAAAEKGEKAAVVWLEATPPARETSAARARREAFQAWIEKAVLGLDAVEAGRALAARAPAAATATADLAPSASRAEGLVVVVDWQWATAGAVAPREGTKAGWERDLGKLLKKAEAAGAAKKALIARLAAEIEAVEADLARPAPDYARAVERARAIAAYEGQVRAPAIGRAQKVLAAIHAIGKSELARLDEDFDHARRSGSLLEWAARVLRRLPKLKRQFPFKDLEDAFADREATAVRIAGAG